MKIVQTFAVLGWFFVVMNANGDPQYRIEGFKDTATCDVARTWAVTGHFKGAVPDAATVAQYASPCFQELTILQ